MGETTATSDVPRILPIEDVRDVADWGGGHPVVGPCARTALFWHEEAERAKATARAWQREAERLGWTPDNGSNSSDG